MAGDVYTWGIKDHKFIEQNKEQLMSDFEFAACYMLERETDEALRQ